MDQAEKYRQEEAELEAQMNAKMLGNPPPTGATTQEETGVQQSQEELEAAKYMEDTIVSDGKEPQPQETTVDTTGEAEPQKPPSTRTNWKKRFTNFKASADASLSAHRQEIGDLKQQVANLMGEVNKMRETKREVPGDMFEGAFTQEDEDTFGADGMAVVKKAAQVAIDSQVGPLKEELRKQENARVENAQRDAQRTRQTAYDTFLGGLKHLVPDYASINTDQAFIDWMKQPDTFSGLPKGTLFIKAEKARDVARVADFFIEYKNEKDAVIQATNRVPEGMERHITPMGAGGSTTVTNQQQEQKGYYRQSDIDKFYRDVMKGRYKGQQSVITATEQAIDQAASEKRILKGQ